MNGDNNGWIPLWRKVLNNEVWQFHPQAWKVYEALLLLCDQKTGVWTGGRKRLSGVVNLSESATYRSLQLLRKKEMILVENVNNRYSKISICKMGDYRTISDNKSHNDRTTTEQRPNTITRIKNKELRKVYKSNDLVEMQNIYDLFIQLFEKNPNTYKLTDKRKLKIKARLKDAGPEMLRKAIENTSKSEFHRGDNDRGWAADLDYIIRSYENTEKLASLETKKTVVTERASWFYDD